MRRFMLVVLIGLAFLVVSRTPDRVLAQEQEIVIGAVYPLSGSLTKTGRDIRDAIELAVEIINGNHDIAVPLGPGVGLPNLGGAKVRVVFADHGGAQEKGRSEAERLIKQGKVVALIGAYNSNVTATASEAAERLGIPFLAPESTAPELTRRGFRWFFRTTPTDDEFSENFFKFLDDMKRRGHPVSTVGLLYENSLFGTGVGRFEKKYAAKYGYKVAADIAYDASSTSLREEILRLKAVSPEVLLQTSYPKDAILSTKTMKELGVRPKAILAMDAGHISSEFVPALGRDAWGILSREVWSLDLSERKPIITQVNTLFRLKTRATRKHSVDMDGVSARTFVGMLVLADAINRAGSTKPEKIRLALERTDLSTDGLIVPWQGVRFDPETHQNVLGNGIIVQIQLGRYRTVYPFDLAVSDVIWPLPAWGQ